MNAREWMAAGALVSAGMIPAVQAQVLAPPQNVLQLSASGSVEAQQDWLSITLTTARDGQDAAVVQSQLKAALEAALAEAKKNAQPGQMDVRTGNFGIYPRYQREGKISGWTGTAELVLEGRDFARISQSAGRIPGMTIGGLAFALSREQRAKVEGDAQQLAIERFKAKASELAKGFGFAGYTLREVTVNASDQGFVPRPRVASMELRAATQDTSPVPVEPGKTAVVVNVSGSVQLK